MNEAYVVDASVIVKWYLTDEEAADRAASLYDHYYRGVIALSAPPLITYEVARAIHRGYRQRRISIDDATRSLADLADLNQQLFHEPEIIAAAYRIAEEYRCNSYGACYLARAEFLGLPLPGHPEESAAAGVSKGADDKLERQLAGRVDYALPLTRLDLAR